MISKLEAIQNFPIPTTKKRVKLLSKPVLRNQDCSRSFLLDTDASAYGACSVLGQEFEDCKLSICFLNKKFSPAESNYAVVEKQCLTIVWAVKSLGVYLEGKKTKLRLIMNHCSGYRGQSYAIKDFYDGVFFAGVCVLDEVYSWYKKLSCRLFVKNVF